MKKRMIALAMALLLALCFVPAAAMAEPAVPFIGTGTAEDPYQLSSASDLAALSQLVASGVGFAGEYFVFTADITLPNNWTPIGTTKVNCFSGIIDGGGHKLTVPANEKALIGFPCEAVLKNLNICGERIDGNGVVSIYTTGISNKTAITIENVTLLSGTNTTGSGFLGGYASGSFAAVIRSCTVQSGVVVGCDGDRSNIGSFGGDFNGTIENCVSYATVKGVDFVGGICGSKGQSIGQYTIRRCTFKGTVQATGNYVGGISGSGYGGTNFGMESSPNAPCAVIENCSVSATVSGGNYVGGILGGEGATYQCWDNGIGKIKNNSFSGKVSATAANARIGGIVGYFAGLDKYNEIENNTYSADCGAAKGIGFAAYVDTGCATHETQSGAVYINSGDQSTPLPDLKYVETYGSLEFVTQYFSKWEQNRTDDPLGADAGKLCRPVYPSHDDDPVQPRSVDSAKTGDAGIALYLVTGVLSVTGSCVLARRRAGEKEC